MLLLLVSDCDDSMPFTEIISSALNVLGWLGKRRGEEGGVQS